MRTKRRIPPVDAMRNIVVLAVGTTNIYDHYRLNWAVDPVGDRIISDKLYLTRSQRSVLIRKISRCVGRVAQTVNEVHDSAPLDSALRHLLQETKVP